VDVLFLVILAVLLALFFAFTNGVHDAASTAATIIACGAATPRAGVVLVAILGFAGALLGGSAVAFTVQGLLDVDTGPLLTAILLAAVVGATAWNLVTWRLGLPSSSTHSLVGGLVGAAVAGAGLGSVVWGLDELAAGELTGLVKVVAFLILSVAVGFAGGFAVRRISAVLLRPARQSINRRLRQAQWLTTAALAFAHGANDAQKQMGVIVLVLLSAGAVGSLGIPLEVRLACAIMMGLGTLGGGWNIMRTLGRKIYPLKPVDSLDSQLTSASSLLMSTALGAPVSTTQVVASSVLGVGAGENARMVQWSIGRHMVVSWFLTIPASAALSALIYIILSVASMAG